MFRQSAVLQFDLRDLSRPGSWCRHRNSVQRTDDRAVTHAPDAGKPYASLAAPPGSSGGRSNNAREFPPC